MLTVPSFAFSKQCIDTFRQPLMIESILKLDDIDHIQELSLLYIAQLANNIYHSRDFQERNAHQKQLELSWNAIKSWNNLRSFDVVLTETIVKHFETRLKATVLNNPNLRQRVYGNQNLNSSFSILNFHYHLPFVLETLKAENLTLKEVSHE